ARIAPTAEVGASWRGPLLAWAPPPPAVLVRGLRRQPGRRVVAARTATHATRAPGETRGRETSPGRHCGAPRRQRPSRAARLPRAAAEATCGGHLLRERGRA